jgi:chromosome segregation ATPase
MAPPILFGERGRGEFRARKVSVESLTKELAEKTRRRAKLIEAIDSAGEIASLTERLRALEGEIKSIENAIQDHRPSKVDDTLKGLREHVTKQLLGL